MQAQEMQIIQRNKLNTALDEVSKSSHRAAPYPMMRLSEYSFFLLKESVRLKKLLAGVSAAWLDTVLKSKGTLVIRIPQEDKYLQKRDLINDKTLYFSKAVGNFLSV